MLRIQCCGFKGQARHGIHMALEQEPALQPVPNCEIDGGR